MNLYSIADDTCCLTGPFDSPESNPRAWKYVSDLLLANAEDVEKYNKGERE